MAPSKEIVTRSQTLATIDPDQTLKASRSLLAHIKKANADKEQQADKKQLLADADEEDGEGEPIWLQVTTKRHIADTNRLKPGRIQLPHPINTSEHLSICIITADNTKDLLREALDNQEVPETLRKRVGKIVQYTSLVKKYGQYEAQRQLFAEHDVFMADDRIINRLPKVLGKTFYKTTTKRPIPINLQSRAKSVSTVDRKNGSLGTANRQPKDKTANFATPKIISSEIEKGLACALVSLTPSTNVQIRVGLSSFAPEQLAANTDVVAQKLVEKWVPQNWKNVKAIWIKGQQTAALPIWQTEELWLSEQDVVADPTEEEKLKLQEKERQKKKKKGKALKENANVGRKRKTLGEGEGEDENEGAGDDVDGDERPAKKSKSDKKKAAPESNDDKLDKQISEHKEKLKKAKAKAKKALD